MRVHHLNCICACPLGGRLMDGRSPSVLQRGSLCCHCMLVETEHGLCLIDTGNGWVADGAASVQALRMSGEATDYVREAFRHAKPLSALGEGAGLLAAAGLVASGARVPGVSVASQPADLAQGFMADMAMHRHWDRAVKSALTT